MKFNKHWELEGKHAFLSPSQYHWVNYTDEKLLERYSNYRAAEMGTRLHAFAAEAIRLGIKLPKTRTTINLYVNDAIRFGMTPEQPLRYSDNCFGTADAILLDERRNLLRIHDLKTGTHPASMTQLMVYAAIFCLEYGYEPEELDMELRLYQNNEALALCPEADDVAHIMERIVYFDGLIEDLKRE